MRGVIVTADDFGLHARVNEAVVLAHRDGVLSAASLMVGAPAAYGAIACARELPDLRVGLHIVLADGHATLAPSTIPDLVDRQGRFGSSMARDGLRFFCLPHVRAQLAAEIRAQFEAFAATGLALDHVNAHKHFHLHPTVLALILEIGREFGMRAMRLPNELHGSILLRPWIALAKARMERAGIDHNDHVAGLRLTGRMDEAAFLSVLGNRPAACWRSTAIRRAWDGARSRRRCAATGMPTNSPRCARPRSRRRSLRPARCRAVSPMSSAMRCASRRECRHDAARALASVARCVRLLVAVALHDGIRDAWRLVVARAAACTQCPACHHDRTSARRLDDLKLTNADALSCELDVRPACE